MKILLTLGLLMSATSFLFAQNIDKIINAKEVERIESKLASDEMRGRRTFTPDIDKAADFIASEFKAIGLQTWNNSGSYRQEFSTVRARSISQSGKAGETVLDEKNSIVF